MEFKACAICCLLFTLVITCQGMKCPGPVAEGESAKLKCQSETPTFTWEVKLATGYATILECANSTCSNAEYTATMRMNGTMYESSLEIHSINRSKTRYRCFDEVCQLEVYDKLIEIDCQYPGLEHHGSPRRSVLGMTCTVNSYPEARCTLESNPPNEYTSRAVPRYEYATNAHGNNITTCHFKMHLKGMEAESFDLTVKATPALSSGGTNVTVAVEQKSLMLGRPKVALGYDCPQDEIQPGDHATCSCLLLNDSNKLDSFAASFTPSGENTGMAVNDTLTTITLVYNPKNPNPNYTCMAVSLNGRLPGLVYSPSFAAHCVDPAKH